MNPLNRADPPRTLNEMHPFIEFWGALDQGFSPEEFLQQQENQAQEDIEHWMAILTEQLMNGIHADAREWDRLIEMAINWTPDVAQEYCDQLTQQKSELQHIVDRQQREFDKAAQAIKEQQEQNANVIRSVNSLKQTLQTSKSQSNYYLKTFTQMGQNVCRSLGNLRDDGQAGKRGIGNNGF